MGLTSDYTCLSEGLEDMVYLGMIAETLVKESFFLMAEVPPSIDPKFPEVLDLP